MAKTKGWQPAFIRTKLYARHWYVLLLLWLAEPRARLDFRRVWAWSNPIERLLQVWEAAVALEPVRAQRVRGKIERFFASSRLLPTRRAIIGVPAAGRRWLEVARAAVREALRTVGKATSSRVRRYMAAKVRAQAVRRPNLADGLSDQIRAASAFDPGVVEAMDEEMATFYDQRRDVRWVPHHVFFQLPDEAAVVATAVQRGIEQWLHSIGQGSLAMDAGVLVQGGAMRTLGANVRQDGAGVADELQQVVRSSLEPGSVLVPLDRDTRRRAAMDVAGYWRRLYTGFLRDADFYRWERHMDAQQAADERQRLAVHWLPQWVQPRRGIAPEQVAKAYHNYKGKCLHRAVGEGDGEAGLVCGRSHAHEREVVSACKCPMAKQMSMCAKALRVCLRECGWKTWTLWNQGELARVVQCRVAALAMPAECEKVCPCGRKSVAKSALSSVTLASSSKQHRRYVVLREQDGCYHVSHGCNGQTVWQCRGQRSLRGFWFPGKRKWAAGAGSFLSLSWSRFSSSLPGIRCSALVTRWFGVSGAGQWEAPSVLPSQPLIWSMKLIDCTGIPIASSSWSGNGVVNESAASFRASHMSMIVSCSRASGASSVCGRAGMAMVACGPCGLGMLALHWKKTGAVSGFFTAVFVWGQAVARQQSWWCRAMLMLHSHVAYLMFQRCLGCSCILVQRFMAEM